jgi:hypothetical protein
LPLQTDPRDLPKIVRIAGKRIKVIPEGRDDDQTLLKSRALLEEATRICFLGFGFDAINIRRLGAPGPFVEKNNPEIAKAIVATAKGLSNAEARRAALRLVGLGPFNNAVVDRFKDLGCEALLRHTLVLDEEAFGV